MSFVRSPVALHLFLVCYSDIQSSCLLGLYSYVRVISTSRMYDTIWREAPDGKKCSCMIVHKGILEVYNYIFYTHAGSHVVSYDTIWREDLVT